MQFSQNPDFVVPRECFLKQFLFSFVKVFTVNHLFGYLVTVRYLMVEENKYLVSCVPEKNSLYTHTHRVCSVIAKEKSTVKRKITIDLSLCFLSKCKYTPPIITTNYVFRRLIKF